MISAFSIRNVEGGVSSDARGAQAASARSVQRTVCRIFVISCPHSDVGLHAAQYGDLKAEIHVKACTASDLPGDRRLTLSYLATSARAHLGMFSSYRRRARMPGRLDPSVAAEAPIFAIEDMSAISGGQPNDCRRRTVPSRTHRRCARHSPMMCSSAATSAGRVTTRRVRFYTEDFQELRDSGYLVLPVPTELGGRGMSPAEVALEQRRLAYRCLDAAGKVEIVHVGAQADVLLLEAPQALLPAVLRSSRSGWRHLNP